MATTAIPASFVVADAAPESGRGASQLTFQANNLLAVKATPDWTGQILSMPTQEFLNGQWVTQTPLWRAYPDWLSSINDHATFLLTNPRYQPAFAYTTGGLPDGGFLSALHTKIQTLPKYSASARDDA